MKIYWNKGLNLSFSDEKHSSRYSNFVKAEPLIESWKDNRSIQVKFGDGDGVAIRAQSDKFFCPDYRGNIQFNDEEVGEIFYSPQRSSTPNWQCRIAWQNNIKFELISMQLGIGAFILRDDILIGELMIIPFSQSPIGNIRDQIEMDNEEKIVFSMIAWYYLMVIPDIVTAETGGTG